MGLLTDVIQATSNYDELVTKHVKGATVTTDVYGNIFITKGEADVYPGFTAKLPNSASPNLKFARYPVSQAWFSYVVDKGEVRRANIDYRKAGLYTALSLVRTLKACKVALYKHNILPASVKWFEDTKWNLILGASSNARFIITGDTGEANEYLRETSAIERVGNQFDMTLGYHTGADKDAEILKKFSPVGFAFIPTGTYNHGSINTLISESEVGMTRDFCIKMATTETRTHKSHAGMCYSCNSVPVKRTLGVCGECTDLYKTVSVKCSKCKDRCNTIYEKIDRECTICTTPR